MSMDKSSHSRCVPLPPTGQLSRPFYSGLLVRCASEINVVLKKALREAKSFLIDCGSDCYSFGVAPITLFVLNGTSILTYGQPTKQPGLLNRDIPNQTKPNQHPNDTITGNDAPVISVKKDIGAI